MDTREKRKPADPGAETAIRKKEEKELDKELQDSFPASDPPSITQPTPEHHRARKR